MSFTVVTLEFPSRFESARRRTTVAEDSKHLCICGVTQVHMEMSKAGVQLLFILLLKLLYGAGGQAFYMHIILVNCQTHS